MPISQVTGDHCASFREAPFKFKFKLAWGTYEVKIPANGHRWSFLSIHILKTVPCDCSSVIPQKWFSETTIFEGWKRWPPWAAVLIPTLVVPQFFAKQAKGAGKVGHNLPNKVAGKLAFFQTCSIFPQPIVSMFLVVLTNPFFLWCCYPVTNGYFIMVLNRN